jgi:ABC-type branched-subunit amino acid transport system ATPase component
MSAALTAEELNTFYGKSHILRRGSGHGPAGRDGAGKTTTLRSAHPAARGPRLGVRPRDHALAAVALGAVAG